MPSKPNVLFIVCDQLRADCVTGALAEHVRLPNIQALRRDAVTFTNHFSVTSPCGPARASLLTGLYAMNHRSVRNGAPLADDFTNLALEMGNNGYQALLFGYTDTSRDPRGRAPDDPVLQNYEQTLPGFHECLEMRQDFGSEPWRTDLKRKGYTLPDPGNFYAPVSDNPSRAPRLDDPPFYRADDSDTAFLTNEFLRLIPDHATDDWLALLAYIRPHPPLVAPAPYNHMYNPHDLPLPQRLDNIQQECAVHPIMHGAVEKPRIDQIVRGFEGQLDQSDNSVIQTLRALYLGLASEVDTHIGRVIEQLKMTGQYDDTIIVFTADHGETLGDHYLWGKENPYDVSFRVPLIIRDPAHPQMHGTNIDALTESVDVAPTILDLTGQAVPTSMDGVSLTPFLNATPPKAWRDHVFLELDFGEPDAPTVWQKATGVGFRRANLTILRETRFKLVHFNGGLPPLLFDLVSDPHELDNLANDPAHAATLLRLTRKLLDHRMSHSDSRLSDIKIAPGGIRKYQP
ncbi:MAG: sulfatase-like hydrolase/transferase [Paracoccaceae bacterium]